MSLLAALKDMTTTTGYKRTAISTAQNLNLSALVYKMENLALVRKYQRYGKLSWVPK